MSQQDKPKKTDAVSKPAILVIEDDKFLRELVVQKLKKEGFDVEAVVEGGEAFKAIEEKTPDLILLDLVLPGIDGFQIMIRLKKNQKTADIPVVVLSNLGQKEDIDKAKACGAADYMVKTNFTPGEIAEKIRKIVGAKKLP